MDETEGAHCNESEVHLFISWYMWKKKKPSLNLSKFGHSHTESSI